MKDTSKINLAPKQWPRTLGRFAERSSLCCPLSLFLSRRCFLQTARSRRHLTRECLGKRRACSKYIDPLEVGQGIDFSLRMPGDILGTPSDVMVQCPGRVVRCSLSQGLYLAAATIDEYRFAER